MPVIDSLKYKQDDIQKNLSILFVVCCPSLFKALDAKNFIKKLEELVILFQDFYNYEKKEGRNQNVENDINYQSFKKNLLNVYNFLTKKIDIENTESISNFYSSILFISHNSENIGQGFSREFKSKYSIQKSALQWMKIFAITTALLLCYLYMFSIVNLYMVNHCSFMVGYGAVAFFKGVGGLFGSLSQLTASPFSGFAYVGIGAYSAGNLIFSPNTCNEKRKNLFKNPTKEIIDKIEVKANSIIKLSNQGPQNV